MTSEVSSIRGVGIDTADVTRIERLVRAHGERFTRRWFSSDEIAQCAEGVDQAAEYAERFAAKEAIWKALRLPDWPGQVPWLMISVLRLPGSPAVRVELAGDVERAAARLGVSQIRVDFRSVGSVSVAAALAECHQVRADWIPGGATIVALVPETRDHVSPILEELCELISTHTARTDPSTRSVAGA